MNMKMEKNFRAHIEKKYPRFPYLHYDLEFWVYRMRQELEELEEAFCEKNICNIREELADLSNLVDFAYERTFIENFDKIPFPDSGKLQLFKTNKVIKES